MKSIYRAICVTAGVAAMSSTSIADEVNSETCAAALSPTAKTIYEAVAPSVDADTNLKKLIKKTVRPMVMWAKRSLGLVLLNGNHGAVFLDRPKLKYCSTAF